MAITPRLMTADELFRLPDDGHRYELVRGELRTMAPPGYQHGKFASRFDRRLGPFVESNQLGEVTTEVGFVLTDDPDTVRAPDLAFIRHERLPAPDVEHRYYRGAPDLAVEVVSPNDSYTEVTEKVAEWLAHGTRLVVVVDPRRRIVTVHRPDDAVTTLGIDDTFDGEDVVPGWQLAIRDLFT
jgi:Uma2 family endonuclease